MLTVIEKVMALQGVDSFSEVSTDELSYLAMIAEEVSSPADEPIYHEADVSDAMYLVLEGRVRLHRGDLEVGVMGPNEAFGTWALFDDEPRVTSATPLEPTHLLKIGKEAFIDLLADHVPITQGVLKAMVRRLRGLVERVGANGRPSGEE